MEPDLRIPAAAALVFAAACSVLTVVQIMHAPFDSTISTTADYVNDGSFTVALLAFPLVVQAFPGGTTPHWARVAGTFGPLLVAIGVLAGLVTGKSPAWFAAVAVPGNLAWLASTVALAVWSWRNRALPRPVAVGLGLTVIFILPFAELGGAAVPAVVFAALAVRWRAAERGGSRPRPQPVRPSGHA